MDDNGLVSNSAPNTTQPHQSNLTQDWKDNQENGFFETIFMVPVGKALATKKEQLLYSIKGPELGKGPGAFNLGQVIDPSVGGSLEQLKTIAEGTTASSNPYGLIYYTKGICRDTTLGGNDALNCYWQYNENDDIAHPFTTTKGSNTRDIGKLGHISMGRVYAETINAVQSILYLGFGVPEFNNLSAWQDNFYTEPYARGVSSNAWSAMVDVLSKAASTVFRAIRGVAEYYKITYGGQIDAPVTNFFAFKSTMPQYFGQVQSLLIILCSNMELMYGLVPIDEHDTSTAAQIQQQMSQMANGQGGIPEYITHYNLDFVKIMLRRAAYETGNPKVIEEADSLFALSELANWEKKQDGNKSPIQGDASNAATNTTTKVGNNASALSILTLKQKGMGWFGGPRWVSTFKSFVAGIRDEMLFIGFRVERSNNSSESLSSSTQPSTIQQALNMILGSTRAYRQSGGGQDLGLSGDLAVALTNKMGAFATLASKCTSLFGHGVAAAIGAGISMADIPESWADSQFSKSYSFNLQLIAPYGDPVTILQTLYVPLCCLLAGSAPRVTGLASYTSPFLCRAYCKGKFAIPMGIIDSLSIDRGASSHGWTHSQLPRTIDISFSIKDLTPNMPLTLITSDMSTLKMTNPVNAIKKPLQAAEMAINYVTRANTTLNQYLMTLAGFGPTEFLIPAIKYRQKLKQLFLMKEEVTFSPFLMGMNLGNGFFNKLYSLYKNNLDYINTDAEPDTNN